MAALQTWDGHFRGLCEPHAAQGHGYGYPIYTADGSSWAPVTVQPLEGDGGEALVAMNGHPVR